MTDTRLTGEHGQAARGGPGRAALLLVPAVAAGAGVAGLADAAREHDGASLIDPVVATRVLELRNPVATTLAHLLTLVGSEVVVGASALVVLAFLLWTRRTAQAGPFALAMSISVVLTVVVKLFVARVRPPRPDVLGPVDHSYSFPSGHTLNSAVLIALLVWLLWGRATALGRVLLVALGVLLAVGIGASRVYLGYHWTTDVLGSWLLAAAVLLIVALIGRPVVRAVTRRAH